jgi:hypothetical protein
MSGDYAYLMDEYDDMEAKRMEEKYARAPFTSEQVESLNAYQVSGVMHPFTCGNDDCKRCEFEIEVDSILAPLVGQEVGTIFKATDTCVLIATENGWVCPSCDYTQTWAWKWMADFSWKKAKEG